MAALKLQFSIRTLIAFTTIVAMTTIGFVDNTFLALAVLAAVGSYADGLVFPRWAEPELAPGASFVGACVGGGVGGVIWLFLQLVISYTLLPYFEDEGLGFIGCMWVFFPFAAGAGALTGSACWLVYRAAYRCFGWMPVSKERVGGCSPFTSVAIPEPPQCPGRVSQKLLDDQCDRVPANAVQTLMNQNLEP